MQSFSRRAFIHSGVGLSCWVTSAMAGGLPRVIGPGNDSTHVRRVPVSLYEMDLDADNVITGSIGNIEDEALPPAESPVDYPITPAGASIPKRFRPQAFETSRLLRPGTIVIDPKEFFLYLYTADGSALRYGVGVGRAGFSWSGEAVVGMKRRWPRWVPPREMVERDEKARRWANGQPGGPGNPLGARALYLYQNGQDTLYRIHGTNQPNSIGKPASSGCIRMLNEHIAEIYDRVSIGAQVIVL